MMAGGEYTETRPVDLRRVAPAAALAAISGVCWILAVGRMRGMDMGPGTDLGALPFFAGLWITMMGAMMLPSALPAAMSFLRRASARRRAVRGLGGLASSLGFAAAYLAVWAAFGLVAFLVYKVVGSAYPPALSWNRAGPYVAGAAVAAAGLYELTPYKRAALERCRDGRARLAGVAPVAGLRHGLDCVSSSVGLMLVMLALGPMSVTLMVFVAATVFVERVPAFGARLPPVIAVLLLALAVGVAASPGSVPGLTLPS
jgi:predicted metal-binding membrane protein